ncbi:MAG: hypothetical protein AAGI38_08140 [Bacteroidota bacterium]
MKTVLILSVFRIIVHMPATASFLLSDIAHFSPSSLQIEENNLPDGKTILCGTIIMGNHETAIN